MFGPCADAAVQGDVAGVATHHFDDEEPVMRIRSVPDLVDRLHGGVHCRIETNGKIRSGNVFIDGARDPDAGDVEFIGKYLGTVEGAVAADHDQSVDPALAQIGIGLLPSFRRPELLGTGGLQDRSTPLDDVGHTAGIHRLDIVFDHPGISSHYAIDFKVMIQSGPHYSPDTCIHAWRISSGCQNADFGYFRGYSVSGHDQSEFYSTLKR